MASGKKVKDTRGVGIHAAFSPNKCLKCSLLADKTLGNDALYEHMNVLLVFVTTCMIQQAMHLGISDEQIQLRLRAGIKTAYRMALGEEAIKLIEKRESRK